MGENRKCHENKPGPFHNNNQEESSISGSETCVCFFAGPPADILPLVESVPKFKDVNKRRDDKGLHLASLGVAGTVRIIRAPRENLYLMAFGLEAELSLPMAELVYGYCVQRGREGYLLLV